jgi:uncharacterized membrane protein
LKFLWGRLNSSFWFVPALLTIASVLLFFLTQYLDRSFAASPSEQPLLFSGGADAARSVLGAISGGIITVAATSFSLAIVTLTLASSQYTPRVMQNFLADRGIQVVLGVFLGTFTYSLMVLRIIRTPSGATEAFVPVISVAAAVLLTFLCVGLLIYFIHHVADMIQSSSIVQGAHSDSLRYIRGLEDLEGSPRAEAEELPATGSAPLVLLCRKSGYVQHLELRSIAEAVGRLPGAGSGKTFVEIPSGQGFFVSAGLPIARIWTPEGAEAGGKAEDKVHKAIITGKERSFQQDFAFGLRQLSDIAILGLSPGVNDPTSSMQAMDRIEAILIALGSKRMPGGLREYEIKGSKVVLRVGYYGFDDVVGLGLDQIRRSAFTSGQVAVLDRFLELVDRALRANPIQDRQYSLWERAFAVARLAPREITDPRDAGNLALRDVEIGAPLLETGLREKVDSDLQDLVRFCEGLPGSWRVREEVEEALAGSEVETREWS